MLDLGVPPKTTKAKWRLRVDGLVGKSLILSWEDFLVLPEIDLTNDNRCVTGWFRFDNRWKEVAAKDLVHIVKIGEGATHCVLYCTDGYTTNVRINRFSADNVTLAHS